MPDLLVLGQVTVDHAVPATPGPWRESLGGNALYAAAGARLWCDPGRIGVVTRLGRGLAGGRAGDAGPGGAAGRRAHGGRRRAPRRVASLRAGREPAERPAERGAPRSDRRRGDAPPALPRPPRAPQPDGRGHPARLAAGARRAPRAAGRRPPRRDRPVARGSARTGSASTRRRTTPGSSEEGELADMLGRGPRIPAEPGRGRAPRARRRLERGSSGGCERRDSRRWCSSSGDDGCLVAGSGVDAAVRIPAAPATVVDLTGRRRRVLRGLCRGTPGAGSTRSRPRGAGRSPRRWWSSAPAPRRRSPCRAPRPSVGSAAWREGGER